MGSTPWIEAFVRTLTEGERITVTRPHGEPVSGLFTGEGRRGDRRFLQVNPSSESLRQRMRAPKGTPGRDEAWDEWFEREEWIPIERGLVVELDDGTKVETPKPRRRS